MKVVPPARVTASALASFKIHRFFFPYSARSPQTRSVPAYSAALHLAPSVSRLSMRRVAVTVVHFISSSSEASKKLSSKQLPHFSLFSVAVSLKHASAVSQSIKHDDT